MQRAILLDMVTMHDSYGTVWIDIENPSKEELVGIQEKYGIHPIVLSELAGPSARTKVDLYQHYAYMIFRFPVILANKGIHSTDEREIDFIVGKDFIITTHYAPIEPLFLMSKFLETSALLSKEHKIEHAGFLFYAIMRKLYQATEEDLYHLHSHMKKIEEAIFAGRERKMVEDISKLNRVLINFWWSTRSHAELLSSFEIVAKKFWGESFHYYLHSIMGEYTKIDKMITGYKEVLTGLSDTNNSLLTTKTNETMKVVSLAAATLLPVTALASIFGMSSARIPLVNQPNGFWIIIASMVALSALSMAYFKYKEWI